MQIRPTISKRRIFLTAILGLLILSSQSLTSCVSTRELVYFQDGTGEGDKTPVASKYTPTVQAGDVLSIQISSLNPEASSFFNPYSTVALAAERGNQNNSFNSTTPLPPSTGYLVDNGGDIELPVIGKLHVKDQTTGQIKDVIRDKVKDYLKEPTVNVRNLNFRISVMGEVMRPALFTIPNEQITLLEALSLSGDVSIYGRRDNVLVIREENGQRTFARLDLTKRDVFKSPYYYLHPNDVVYVEPGKAKAATADRTNQLLPIAISALSFLAIIASRFW